jgi:hypothetical protein
LTGSTSNSSLKALARRSLLGQLEQDLEERLTELKREQSVIHQLLRILKNGSGQSAIRAGKKKSKGALEPSHVPRLTDRVLALIQEDPGIRTSMVALSLGINQERASAAATELAADGVIRREGLGWSEDEASEG